MANQGQLQTQQISASIGMQESQNQIASARGAAAIQATERSGDQWVQQANMDRQATLLGMQMGQSAGANTGYQQAQANQMNASIANQQTTADLFGTIGAAAGDMDFSGKGKSKSSKLTKFRYGNRSLRNDSTKAVDPKKNINYHK
jgi:hypothetical protein